MELPSVDFPEKWVPYNVPTGIATNLLVSQCFQELLNEELPESIQNQPTEVTLLWSTRIYPMFKLIFWQIISISGEDNTTQG